MKRQNRVALFNILSTILLNGISFFTAPLFMQLLGDSGYGMLKIYNIWVGVLAIVFTLQTQGTLVNARVEYPEEEQKHYQSAVLTMSTCFFLTCSVLVLILLTPISALLKLEPLLVVWMLIHAFGNFCVSFLNTKYIYEFKAGRNMAMSLAITLVTLVLSVVFILQLPYETKYYGRVVAIAGTYALVGIPACIAILLQGRTFFHKKYWKFCIVLAIPAIFHNLSDLVLGQSDQVMLQQMLGEAQLGRYSAAYTFANIMFVIFGALNRTWCPFFFEEMKLGQRENMMAKTHNFMELFTILSCGFILLAPEVYYVYANGVFRETTSLIPIFMSGYYINFLCTFPVNFEYYHKQTKVVAVVTISASLVNIALNYVLILSMGAGGAALATTISHGLQLVVHHIYTTRLGKGSYPFRLGTWGKYALGYFTVVGFVYLAEGSWLLRWGLGAALGVFELLQIRKRKVLI